MRYLGQALINLTKVGVQFKIRDNTYDNIVWLDESVTQPSKANVNAEIIKIKENEETNKNKLNTDKTNANNKLKALGLTDDEIKAIKGIA
tara:strand:+ start:550 stop:819 length:270 start_codon:yes stop_codon:yes gene_type:complete